MGRCLLTFAAGLAALLHLSNAQTPIIPVPTYAPVPTEALGPEIPHDVGYRLESFGDGLYMITDGQYQSMFLVGNESVIAVDAPPTIGHNLMKGIRTITDLPISHMVYSHAHADHIAAAYLLVGPETIIIAQDETTKLLAASVNKARPLPDITFTHDHELQAGNQTLHLSYKGVVHEPGNIYIYAPTQKVLMLVDVIYPGWAPFANLAESVNIPGWIAAHDQILSYDFTHMVTGHVNRAGTRADVLTQREYVHDLFDNCVRAILLAGSPANATNPISANTTLPPVFAANPDNMWAVARYIDDEISAWCNDRTNEKWLGRLAGVDVYGLSNADTLTESLRLDYGILGAVGVQPAQGGGGGAGKVMMRKQPRAQTPKYRLQEL